MKIKGFDKDLRCRGFQFEIGETYDTGAKELQLCSGTVFHYCDSLRDIHTYYDCHGSSRFCEIEALGEEVTDGKKCGSNKIKIVREITGEELLTLKGLINGNTGLFNSGNHNPGNRNSGGWNSGDWNTGDYNTGNCNSGDFNPGDFNPGDNNSGDNNSGCGNSGYHNSGYYNSGDWNSGHHNSGDWNNCDYETGFFNTKQSDIINVFNKPCSRKVWGNATKPKFIYFSVIEWIYLKDMTNEEKRENPNCETLGGYLKTYDYKEAFQKSYNDLGEEEKAIQTNQLKALPNFDADVFYEISGIRIS